MSKQTFQAWLDEQDYYINSATLTTKMDEHDVDVELPLGIGIMLNDDGTTEIPERDIYRGKWSDK